MPSFTATTTYPKTPQIPYNRMRKTVDIVHTGTSDGTTSTTNVVKYDNIGDQDQQRGGVRMLPGSAKALNIKDGDDPTKGLYFVSVGGNVFVEWAEQF